MSVRERKREGEEGEKSQAMPLSLETTYWDNCKDHTLEGNGFGIEDTYFSEKSRFRRLAEFDPTENCFPIIFNYTPNFGCKLTKNANPSV